jgi:hypothetical protein
MTHVVTYAPADGGYLVTCSDGCKLGASARQPNEQRAQRRVELHRIATGSPEHVDCPNYETGFDQGAACDLTATTMYPQPGNCFQRGWNAGWFAQHRLHYTGSRILDRAQVHTVHEILDQLLSDEDNSTGFIDTTSGGRCTPTEVTALRADWRHLLDHLASENSHVPPS